MGSGYQTDSPFHRPGRFIELRIGPLADALAKHWGNSTPPHGI